MASSASGRMVVVLSQHSFWVFETRWGTLICSRVSAKEKKKTKLFGRRSKSGNHQGTQELQYHDRAFHCAALSDKYLAIGVDDMIMVFAVEGVDNERPVFCDEFQCTIPEKLKFSPNGEQLAVVLRDEGNDRTQVLIYSTTTFSAKQSRDVKTENDCSSKPSENKLGILTV